jgi:Family of unknown function (DUF6188)
MYGLPEDFDATFLLGATLVQVCVGSHEVILRFAEDIDITIECDVDVVTPAESVVMESAPEIGSAFIPVLNQRVTAAHGSPDGDLMIELGAVRFTLHDSSESYESYQVRNGDHLVVV